MENKFNEIQLSKIKGVDYDPADREVGIFGGEFCIVAEDEKGKEQQIYLSDIVMVELFDKLEKYAKRYYNER